MRKFLLQVLIFVSPFLVLFGLPFFVFAKSGEFISLSQTITRQLARDKLVLFGRVYTDSRYDRDYKLTSIAARRPEVIMVGSSRVLGYRSIFFKDKNKFYNAGRSIANLADLNDFIDFLPPEQSPKILIVSLDQNFFFHEWRPDPGSNIKESPFHTFFKYSWHLLYTDYFHHKFTVADLFRTHNDLDPIGLNAVVNRKGFRNDGSYYYGDIAHNPEAVAAGVALRESSVADFAPDFCRSKYYGEYVRPQALAEFEKFLKATAERHISVIGFTSPYPPAIHDKLQSTNNCSKAMNEFTVQVRDTLIKNGAGWFDSADVRTAGGSDTEFFDADGHYSEKLALRILIAMGKSNPELATYVDVPYLRGRLETSRDNFMVFSEPL